MTFSSFLTSMRRCVGLSLLCAAVGVHAQAPAAPVPVVLDRDQPMNAEADEMCSQAMW